MSKATRVPQLRVLVGDDHAPSRDEVRLALEKGGMTVCAEATNAAETVQRAFATRPDICLLEVRMPGGGIAAAWEISASLPTTRTVMLTFSDDDADLFGALHAGAVGYLVKDMDLTSLPPTLRGVMAGDAAIPPALVIRLVKQFRTHGPRFRTTTVETDSGARLTSREWQVLAALADGLSTREIAGRLQLRPSGVRAYISSVVRKLGVSSREEAAAFVRNTAEG